MADVGRFDPPRSDAVAHRTLPLGSKARVRNLGNGRSATVTVRDRGPRAPGRPSGSAASHRGPSRRPPTHVAFDPARDFTFVFGLWQVPKS